jgi:hypothetical protein
MLEELSELIRRGLGSHSDQSGGCGRTDASVSMAGITGLSLEKCFAFGGEGIG